MKVRRGTGAWTKSEDICLYNAVHQFLQQRREWERFLRTNILPCSFSWTFISNLVRTRNPKQCRERWMNQLSPTINNDPWTEEEDSYLQALFLEYPRRWCQIARQLNRRTQNQVKSRWKKLQRQQRYKSNNCKEECDDESNFMAEIAHLLTSS